MGWFCSPEAAVYCSSPRPRLWKAHAQDERLRFPGRPLSRGKRTREHSVRRQTALEKQRNGEANLATQVQNPWVSTMSSCPKMHQEKRCALWFFRK